MTKIKELVNNEKINIIIKYYNKISTKYINDRR